MREKVSLYIPAYNAGPYLADTLAAINHIDPCPDEVIVVDDGSFPSLKDTAASFGAKYVPHAQNQGLGAARNTGFITARYPLVAALDADVRPTPAWLGELLRELETHPELAGVGGRLIELYQDTPADRWRARHMPQDHGTRRQENIDLNGSNTLWRKDAWERVQGYDERCTTNGEDVRFCREVMGAVGPVAYQPEAVCYHLRRDTADSVVRTMWRWIKPGKDSAGVYRDKAFLLNTITETFKRAADMIEADRGFPELQDISRRAAVDIARYDIETARRQGTLTDDEARFLVWVVAGETLYRGDYVEHALKHWGERFIQDVASKWFSQPCHA